MLLKLIYFFLLVSTSHGKDIFIEKLLEDVNKIVGDAGKRPKITSRIEVKKSR